MKTFDFPGKQKSIPNVFFSMATAVLSALVIWVGTTLYSSQIALEKIKVETTYMREFMEKPYTYSKTNSTRLNQFEGRLGKLEVQMHSIMTKNR